jgi:hypothetical protein
MAFGGMRLILRAAVAYELKQRAAAPLPRQTLDMVTR